MHAELLFPLSRLEGSSSIVVLELDLLGMFDMKAQLEQHLAGVLTDSCATVNIVVSRAILKVHMGCYIGMTFGLY